jgi:hypothetical protein
MDANRRVSAPTFFRNRLLTVSAAATVLRIVEQNPAADNARLSALTGLGVTTDENDGVLPTTLQFLKGMDFIDSSTQPGVRYALTPVGQLVLRNDPYLEQQATVALMALLLSEPYRGAHLFDWVVRGTLQKLRAFRLDSLRQDVNALATDEVGRGAYENLDRVMEHFFRPEAFGAVSPWVEASAGSGESRYEPQRTLEELPEPLFWVCAFIFLRGWRDAFPNSPEATGRDVRLRLFPALRGVLGLKEKGKAEEQLMVSLHREGIVASSSVTKERITLLQPTADPLFCVKKLYGCG